MSSHHRSGGPPSLMDDVHDFDRNFHSHRFEDNRGGYGRGGGVGMRGRGGEGGGMRGRGGHDGGFGHRGGSRGGRGDFHQHDRFNNNHNQFNRPNDDQRSGQSKVPSLFDVEQQQPSRPFDRDFNRGGGGGRGRMPYPRGGGASRRDSFPDDRNRSLGNKPTMGEGPPSLLDFGSEKAALPSNASNNSLPSLLSVQVESSDTPPTGSDMNKSSDTHNEHHHHGDDNSSIRSDHSSHRDNQGRYRDRDSQRPGRGGFDRSSSFNRDRSRSPRDRHSHSRDDHSFGDDHRRNGGRGGRGGGNDHFGRGGRGAGHHNNSREPHQSRFGPDNNQPPRHDRREGGRGGNRGGFHDRQRDMNPHHHHHHHSSEQLPPDNHPFNRNGRPNYDGALSQNRPFQESFQHGNYDPMGPPQQNRPSLLPPAVSNRPDFYPPNSNNSSYSQPHTRSDGRPSRFSDRQDDYDDNQPLTKPNFSLPNVTVTTAPLYFNQPTNPTFSQARPPMMSTFSSQQGVPPQAQQPPPFGWGNQQQQQQQPPPPQQGGPNTYMNQALASIAASSQSNPNMPTAQSSNPFYGNNNDFHRQPLPPSANQHYPAPPQSQMPPSTAGANPAANANNAEAWQQYYQQYWQYMQQQQQQQQQQQTGVQPPTTLTNTPQQFPQGLAVNSSSATSNTQDAASSQANTNAWTQYWMQCQAYMQQQQQQQQQQQSQSQNPSTTTPATITAPSQLYSQSAGKQQASLSNSASNANSLSGTPVSNWQTWFNPKG
ncbi:unnamed protein product [Adineta ricciae]|uniref:Uncharacterized protein n=1 Tax=Adineta ricciae TaxID=249248 RepID=A0A815CZJ9_ADIRI|nr:unnamed protein product [Adineta ricciae]